MCKTYFLRDGEQVCCHGNGIIYGKNWGMMSSRELLPQFFTNSHEIWHRCLPLGVDVQDTFFAVVESVYPVRIIYCWGTDGAGVLVTFSEDYLVFYAICSRYLIPPLTIEYSSVALVFCDEQGYNAILFKIIFNKKEINRKFESGLLFMQSAVRLTSCHPNDHL